MVHPRIYAHIERRMHEEPNGWLKGAEVIMNEALMTALIPRIGWKYFLHVDAYVDAINTLLEDMAQAKAAKRLGRGSGMTPPHAVFERIKELQATHMWYGVEELVAGRSSSDAQEIRKAVEQLLVVLNKAHAWNARQHFVVETAVVHPGMWARKYDFVMHFSSDPLDAERWRQWQETVALACPILLDCVDLDQGRFMEVMLGNIMLPSSLYGFSGLC